MVRPRIVHVLVALAALNPSLARGAEPAKETAKPAKPASPETCTVKAERLRIVLTLDGIFEARTRRPLSVDPEAWGAWKPVDAVAAGMHVNKGDVVLRFDSEDLMEKIADVEAGMPLIEAKLKEAEAALARLEEMTPRKIEAAKRKLKIAEEDHKRFLAIDDAFAETVRGLQRRRSVINREIAEVEMKELQKMYEADDLVETTEEHVLKRQQHRLDWARLEATRSKLRYDWDEKIGHPRSVESAARRLRDTRTEVDFELRTLPMELHKKRLEVVAMKRGRKKATENLAKLNADLKQMTVRAPVAGVVYYGQCVRGSWATAGAIAKKLEAGAPLGPNEVFMTIVQLRDLFVHAKADEKHLRDLAVGSSAKVVPTGFPESKLAGKVDAVAIAPGGPEPYAIHVSVAGVPQKVLPGMTCKLRLTVVDKKEAITVPKKAVFSDDEDERYVHVKPKVGEPARRAVTVGRTKGDRIEVTQGLAEGDVVLLTKPSEKQ
jgi:multidrug efflux pump subunit AcrA (membrane-fusion protein)